MFKRRFVSTLAIFALVFVFSQTSVSAKDEWRAVRSKNFYLIGNAEENDIRKVAAKLEQFREAFRQVFTKINFNSPIPTTVVVFKSDDAYNPYKPIKSNGKTDRFVAGYFQPGDDVNYITLSTEGDLTDAYETIFHEYVHFLIGNNVGDSNVPPWFDEGLAEYYSTFAIEDDRKVTFGAPKSEHLELLRRNKLIPSNVFFNTDNFSLHQQSDDGVGLFYAQSWALMHYLMHGNGGARNAQLFKFLDFVMSGKTPKQAFTEAFQADYAAIEKELKNYIEQNSFRLSAVTLKDKLSFDTEIQSAPLPEADAKAYLGDLLLHTNRLNEAETLLRQVLMSNPNSSMVLVSIGVVKLWQNDLSELEKFL